MINKINICIIGKGVELFKQAERGRTFWKKNISIQYNNELMKTIILIIFQLFTQVTLGLIKISLRSPVHSGPEP